MKTLLFFLVAALLLNCLPQAVRVCFAAPDAVYAYKEGASIRKEKSPAGKVVFAPEKGQKLMVKGFSSPWYEVETETGETGWIHMIQVSFTPPQDSGDEEIGDLLEGLEDSGITLAAAESARSIRGKNQKGLKSPQEKDVYEKEVQNIITFYVTEEEALAFLGEAGLEVDSP